MGAENRRSFVLFGTGALGVFGVAAVLAGLKRAGYSWAEIRCLFVHRWILRTWLPGFAALGIGYGPREECSRCHMQWGTAWAGDIIA
jgi:hypothetical protein